MAFVRLQVDFRPISLFEFQTRMEAQRLYDKSLNLHISIFLQYSSAFVFSFPDYFVLAKLAITGPGAASIDSIRLYVWDDRTNDTYGSDAEIDSSHWLPVNVSTFYPYLQNGSISSIMLPVRLSVVNP